MDLGIDFETAVYLPRAFLPLELQKNFQGLRRVPLFFASYCKKFSDKQKVHTRVIVVTLDHLYLCHPNGDITRCVLFELITKIFHDPQRKHLAIIVPDEYDILLGHFDTFHVIHVIDTLRTLHGSNTPLQVETIQRGAMKPAVVAAATLPSATAQPPVNSKAIPAPPSLWQRVKMRLFQTPRPGIIVGWNDDVGEDEDGSGENVVGCENEVALGKGYYALRLKRPKDFTLQLYNVNADAAW